MSNYDGKISLPEQNVANNVANTNSQHLTEQWKQDKLTDGLYYVKMPNGDFITLGWYELKDYKFAKDADKIKVLSPVPTYAQVADDRKMVEDLKQQLKEANEILFKVWYCREDRDYYAELAESYLEKYGVDK